MGESNLHFGKIVANPSAYSWSQAYNAGKLFAVISLETNEEIREKDYLNVLGKEILDTLEQEFFTLETKDLDSIKKAIEVTAAKIPQDINCSFVIGCIVNNILYVYIIGSGQVLLKRAETLGSLLESGEQKANSLKDASGFLQDNDVVILETKQFSNIVSLEKLSEHLGNFPISEAAENLAPLVHEKEEAGASAIIVSYQTVESAEDEQTFAPENVEPLSAHENKESQDEETNDKEISEPKQESPFYSSGIQRNDSFLSKLKPNLTSVFSRLKPSGKLDLNHPRKVILTIVIVILVVFVGSVFFAIKKQQDTKTLDVFNSAYPQAQKKYDEGQGLEGLNQSLAHDSFTQAENILNGAKDKLPKNSTEETKVLALLAKVNQALGQTSGVSNSSTKQVDLSTSPILLAETKNQATYFSQDSNNIYGLTDTGIFTLKLDGSSKTTIIKNNSFWQQGVAVFPYNGNVYVLDKKQNQIVKFVGTSSGFSNTNYFSSASPDFSKAVSMAIDKSIYVLSSNGDISKFTSGSADNFSVSGLDKNLSNPTRIFTTIDDTNVYILDNGNSRIVVLDKTGKYVTQYPSSVIKSAKDFDVSESDKKIYVLSGGKAYEIDLK